jgi:tetratricopeptide (TPR) repeat protein
VINHPDLFKPETPLEQFSSAQLAHLDLLPLPSEIGLLAETALALALDERKFYSPSAQILGDVLKSPDLPDAAPSRCALHLLRGNALYSAGVSTDAIAEYKEAIHLNAAFYAAHNNLGAALDYNDQHDAAANEFREAIHLNPKYALAYYNLGVILAHKGQNEAAAIQFRKALSNLKPRSELAGLAHHNLGTVFQNEGKDDAAIDQFTEAIRARPELFAPHINLAVLLNKKGQYDAAVEQLREAIRIAPRSTLAHRDLSIFLVEG